MKKLTPLLAVLGVVIVAPAAVAPVAGAHTAQAANARTQTTLDPGLRGPGYGYDVANSAYFNSGGVKTTPILDISKLEAADLIKTNSLSDFDQSIDVGSDITEYSKSLSGSVGVSGGIGAFRASVKTSFGSTSKATAETSFITNNAVSRKREYWIQGGSNVATLTQYLSDQFKHDVNNPAVTPAELFKTYGTHLLDHIALGGTLSMNYRYNNVSQESTTRLSVEARAAYGAVSGSASTEQQTAAKHLTSNSEISIKSSGGTNSIDATSIDSAVKSFATWEGSINPNDPTSLAFVGGPSAGAHLSTWATPIWAFATDEHRRNAIEHQFNEDLLANATYFKTLQEPVTYVKDIYVAAAGNSTAAEASLREKMGSGHHVMFPAQWDLNHRAGGDYIYVGYTTTTDPSQAVTDVVITDGKYANGYSKNGVSFQSTNLDLNQHAGGAYLWLLYTHDHRAAAEPGKVVRDLGVQIGGAKTANVEVGPGWKVNSLDLNRKAGGSYVYLWNQLQVPSTH